MRKRRDSGETSEPGDTLPTERLEAPFAAEVQVPYLREAPTLAPQNQIHARRVLPPVPEGEDVPDLDPSPQLALDLPQPMGLAPGVLGPTDELVLLKNTELGSVADNNTASNVGEPSVASNGAVVFYTGNWYAAVSRDGGDTFQFVDPDTAFPRPPGMQFCCDQVVHYIRKIDTFVWLLQYSANSNGENIQRLAFARTADVRQGRWRLFDISSQSLGLPNVFLDFPDLAVGTNMLYMTTNGFVGQQWRVSVLVRLPLSGIASGNITAQQTLSRENPSFRVAQYCGTRAFWASHRNTSTLRIFSWHEQAAQPTFNDVAVAKWVGGNGYLSQTPDGGNWLGRADPRITGATQAGGELWFAWGANRGGANNRPNPYVQIARIRTTTLNVLDNINIWDADSAICYAALASNSNREVGISYCIGGGGRFPSHVVGILTGTRKDVVVAEGGRSPDDEQWGDYLTIRRHYPRAKLFAATGFTLQNAIGPQDATPRFVLFARASDA